MKMKGKKAITGLTVAGLLATVGVGTALAEQGPSEDAADHLAPNGGALESSEPVTRPYEGSFEESADHLVAPGPNEERVAVEEGLAVPPEGVPVFVDIGTLVDVLGLSFEGLDAQIMEGKSLAEIAGKEKTPELIDTIVSVNKERIESERAAGRLSDEEAADAAKDLRNQVTKLVNSEGPKDPPSVRPADGSKSGDEQVNRA